MEIIAWSWFLGIIIGMLICLAVLSIIGLVMWLKELWHDSDDDI